MIKVKLEQVVNAQPALQDLGSKQLIAKSAFLIRRVLKVVSEQLETYETTRLDLIKKYGNQNGEQWSVPLEKQKDYFSELNPLLEQEVSLMVERLPFDVISDVKISGANLLALDWLIDDPVVTSNAD